MLSPVSASPLLGCIAPEGVCDRLSPVLCQQLKVRATIALAVSSMSDKPSDLALVSVGFIITHAANLSYADALCC